MSARTFDEDHALELGAAAVTNLPPYLALDGMSQGEWFTAIGYHLVDRLTELGYDIVERAISPNEEMALLAALRYMLGRQSYGVGMVTEHLTSRIPAMSMRLRGKLADEIDAVERGESDHANWLGDERCDAVRWRALRYALRAPK